MDQNPHAFYHFCHLIEEIWTELNDRKHAFRVALGVYCENGQSIGTDIAF